MNKKAASHSFLEKPFVIFAKQYALFVTKEHESTYNDCDAVCCRHGSNRL